MTKGGNNLPKAVTLPRTDRESDPQTPTRKSDALIFAARYHVSSWTVSSWTGLGIGLGLGLGLGQGYGQGQGQGQGQG